MKLLYTLAFITSSLFVVSQTKPASYKEYFQEGSYLLLEGNMERAQENFEVAYLMDSSSANINYMLGICYLQSALQKAKAEHLLAKAVKNISKAYKTDLADEKAAPPLALFYYSQALHINYKFDEAMKQAEEFKKYIDVKDKEWEKMMVKEKTASMIAKTMVANPINVQITNLGDSINSMYPEYSPVFSADERMIIYTTRRPNTTGGQKTDDGRYFEDIVVSYKDDQDRWSKPVSLSTNVNTPGHEASINLSPDGQTLIVFKNDIDKNNPEGNGNIYYSTFDGKDWSPLKDFGSNINSPYWEDHACLSADGNVLFFSSERPGGYGGKDIYRCIKLPNGKWSKALNMGAAINTEYDEDGSFIHPDGQTFFFASNGNKTMGGYDIMFATLNEENKFSNVTNIGYPINTTDDDIFYVTSPDGKRGYFSSAKEGGFGEKDIYKITIAESKESFLALFKGQLIPAEGETLPDNITILVSDKQTNEIIGTYRPKLVNGTFSTILPPGKEYNFSYQTDNGEEFYNEDVFVGNDLAYQEIKREVSLEPVKLVGKVKVKQKSIFLNSVVLNNSKAKKNVPGAKLTLEEKGGATQNFETNANGRYDGIVLQPEKTYILSAEAAGKKSKPTEISTVGNKSAKIINQVVYLEGKSEKFTSKELLLDVFVKNSKTKKAIANVNVTLTDAEGQKYEAVTDSKGMVKNIELSPETKYELMGSKDGTISDKETFTTTTVADAKHVAKTLFIAYEANGTDNVSLPASDYEFYHKYNHNVINESEPIWINFIDNIVELSKKKKTVRVNIKASASKVPTRSFKNNKQLAASRGKKLETLIRKTLSDKGVKMSKIKFVRTAAVGGPKYKGDWNLGRKKYEAFQFVKAKAK